MNALEIRQLRYGYPDGTEALCGIDLTVAEGERVGLVGPNGAGKSTLLLHLNGLLPETPAPEAAVEVFGTPVAPPHLEAVRSLVGLLFQDPDDQLFCPTVGEDVAFGPRQQGLTESQVRERVTQALEQVGLTGFERRVPHHLSRGQRRRACLAGLLACRPRVLVLDEPTSDLDPRGRRELKALLRALPVTLLICTHDLELVVELCGRVIVLDAGRVVTTGIPGQVLADERLMLQHGLERPHILSHRHPHGG